MDGTSPPLTTSTLPACGARMRSVTSPLPASSGETTGGGGAAAGARAGCAAPWPGMQSPSRTAATRRGFVRTLTVISPCAASQHCGVPSLFERGVYRYLEPVAQQIRDRALFLGLDRELLERLGL